MTRRKTKAPDPQHAECVLCHTDISDVELSSPRVYQLVNGFVSHRSGGGTNAIRLKNPTGRYAHQTCVDREARLGVNARQLQL